MDTKIMKDVWLIGVYIWMYIVLKSLKTIVELKALENII